MKVIKPRMFEAEILDSDLLRGDLIAEAHELLVEYCRENNLWLLKKPKVRVSHITQKVYVEAYVYPRTVSEWAA